MNFLVALSTMIAYLYSILLLFTASDDMLFFEIQVVLLTTIYIGHQLEEKIKSNANKELKELLNKEFNKIPTKSENTFEDKHIEFIKAGNIIRVRPGDTIPLDGKITKGKTKVNEALLTGEENLISKIVGDAVTSGAINNDNIIEIEVSKDYKNSYLNVLVSQVEQVTKSKPRIQKIGDKIIQFFVPIIILLSIIAFTYWYIVSKDFSYALYVSLSTLIIACPCALGLATPISFMLGSRQFNKKQILVRTIDSLLPSHKITTIAFDKTGTLIDKQVVSIKTYKDIDNSTFATIKSIESTSVHPLAKMITKYLDKYESINLLDEVQEIKGQGMVYNNIEVGSYKILRENDLKRVQDISNIFVIKDGELIIEFILDYQIKPEASGALSILNQKYKTVMITGDQWKKATQVSKELHFNETYAEVMPEKKIQILKDLQNQGEKIMYIGDGINDTLALAQANISVAIN